MSISHSSNRRRLIAGASLVGLSVTFLAHTVMGLTNEPGALSQTTNALVGFEAVLNSLLMTGALLGLAQLLRARADWAGLLGAAFALVGWAVATRISALIQIDALLRAGVEGVPPAALESAFKSAPIVWTSVFPVGLFFPLGLITLGVALCWRSPLYRWCGLPLALGGLLFPVGRAAGHEFAVIACDLLLAAAFAAFGWGILTRPEAWETTPGGNETLKSSVAG